MNAMSDSQTSLAAAFDRQPHLRALLLPLAPEAPCGVPLRHDAVFTEIRLLREEDDPSLPMGQWERPLKRADWPRIEHLCSTVLTTRSKDLQLAAWLAEAWTRQHGLAGLVDGLQLLDALVRSYWSGLHPLIGEDGDSDARLAPLEWVNGALAACVRMHAALFRLDEDKALPVTLALWERLTVQEMAPADASARNAPPSEPAIPTRADILERLGPARAALAQSAAAAGAALAALHSIAAFLQECLQDEAPNLGKLEGTLEAVLRVLAHCQPEESPVPGSAILSAARGVDVVETGAVRPEAANVPALPPPTAPWRNRREAYAMLEALADYLAEVEPHSPTPFLLRRAANWGAMSLPEVIAEIIREEGDVTRFFQVLGMKL